MGGKVSYEHILDGLGKNMLSLFAVDLLSGAWLALSFECLSKSIFWQFAIAPLSGATLNLSWECRCRHILLLFAVDPLSGASLDLPRVCLDNQILWRAAVDPISDASSDSILGVSWWTVAFCGRFILWCLFWECLGKSNLSLFAIDPLRGAPFGSLFRCSSIILKFSRSTLGPDCIEM